MPPKVQFSKAQLLESAFEIARSDGLQGLSARSLAQKLGCSTSPIYTAFETMRELEELICERSTKVMLEFQTVTRTGAPLLDMLLGYVLFAVEEKQLFRDMFLEKQELSEHSHRMKDFAFDQLLKKVVSRETSLAGFGRKKRLEILDILWAYAHGLAAQLCIGAREWRGQDDVVAKLRMVIDPLLLRLRAQALPKK